MTTSLAVSSPVLDDKARIAELEDLLQDIAMGAQMVLPTASGAFAGYIREVDRVARAGLPESRLKALDRMKGGSIFGNGFSGPNLPDDLMAKLR